MARKVRVAVIGGGLGGLCAASALLHHGHEVHVYEAAPQLLEVGGGLTLGPNAMKPVFEKIFAEFAKPGSSMAMKRRLIEGEYVHGLHRRDS